MGAHLDDMFGPRYAVIGSALCTSEVNGIGQQTDEDEDGQDPGREDQHRPPAVATG